MKAKTDTKKEAKKIRTKHLVKKLKEEKKISDDFVQNQELEKRKTIPLRKNEEPYIMIWDCETSGLSPTNDKIIEIGCYIVSDTGVEEKHWMLNNKIDIPEKITEITGITKEIIDAEGRDPKECLQEFLPLFKECQKNITHNGIRFDIPFLVAYAASVLGWDEKNKEAVRSLLRLTAFDTAVHFKAKKLDMAPMEKEHFVNFADRVMEIRAYGVKYNLALCVEELGIKLDVPAHRAMGDVANTYEIYKTIKPV